MEQPPDDTPVPPLLPVEEAIEEQYESARRQLAYELWLLGVIKEPELND